MAYLIAAFLMILGIVKKKSKLLFILQIVWLWIFMGGNNVNADYANYEYRYKLISMSGIKLNREVLYDIFSFLSQLLGFNYVGFRMLIVAIALLLIGITLKKYSYNPCFALSLFMLYPLLDSIIQMRTLITMAILVFSIKYLIEDKRGNTIKFIICILIASGFHNLALFYLILVLSKFCDIKQCAKVSAIMLVVSIVAVSVLPQMAALIISKENVTAYFDSPNRLSIYKVIGIIIWQLCGMILTFLVNGKIMKGKVSFVTSNNEINKENKAINTISKINVLLSVIFPFYIFSSLFMRVYRSTLLLNYLAFSNKSKQGRKYNVTIPELLFVLYALLTFIYFNCISNNMFETIVRVIYENNIFW